MISRRNRAPLTACGSSGLFRFAAEPSEDSQRPLVNQAVTIVVRGRA